jgi:hypothetical protein
VGRVRNKSRGRCADVTADVRADDVLAEHAVEDHVHAKNGAPQCCSRAALDGAQAGQRDDSLLP